MSQDLKRELTLLATLPAAPSLIRAQSLHVSVHPVIPTVVAYPSGNNVIVRDLASGLEAAPLFSFRHAAATTVARFSPNGQFVASGDKDGVVVIWANRPETTEKYKSKQLNGAVRDIAWTEDNERILIVGEGRGDYASVITVSGSNLGEITGHSQNILSGDFRKVKPFKVFTAGADSKVCFLEGPPFKFSHSVAGTFLKSSATCVRVSPDNNLAAVVSGSADILILDAVTGKQTKVITTDHQGTVYAVAWSADSAAVFTASADKTVKGYLVDTAAQIFSSSLGKAIGDMQQSVAFSPDLGVISIALDGTLRVLDANSGKETRRFVGHQKPVIALFVDADAGVIVSFGSDACILRTTTASSLTERISMESAAQDCITAATYTNTSKQYVAVCGTDLITFDVAASCVKTVSKDANHALGVAALGGSCVALVYKSSVAVIDLRSGKKVWEEKLPQFDGASIASHEASNTFAVGGDKVVRVYRWSDGKGDVISTFSGSHPSTVSALAFSPEGTTIASGDSTKNIFVWNIADAKIVHDGLAFHTLRVSSLVFESSDTLISGSVDCSVIRWHLSSKTRRIQDQSHRGGVTAVSWDTRTGDIVSAGGDFCLRRWSAAKQ